MKTLPIGTQDFETLRRDNCLYVDKTADIHRLITEGRVYFLARPRRFGKSLLVSTLKAIFKGRRDLFQGLAIDALPYEWKPHPVLHLDFGAESWSGPDALNTFLSAEVDGFLHDQGIAGEGPTAAARLRNGLRQLHARGEQTAVLIDEYDKPLLDHIEDTPMALRMRETLKGFYGSLKSSDAYLRFILLTGVSKFAKMNVFSGLNNLNDITMDDSFATMLGYTQAELEFCFADYIAALAERLGMERDRCLADIRDWYNGYRFHYRAETVYNPFSTLLLFQKRDFANYWFETGTPTFLIKLLNRMDTPSVSELDHAEAGAGAFSTFDPERLAALPLLFQTGYLTILSYENDSRLYRLGYPNREVRGAFTESLLTEFSSVENGLGTAYAERLRQDLLAGDLAAFFETMSVFFANIPYDIQIRSEKYYQSIFFLIFSLLGLRIEAEARTNRGRIDAVAATKDAVYLFEFKLDGTAEEALAQCRESDYARRYRAGTRPVTLVGVPFDTTTRNIGPWLSANA